MDDGSTQIEVRASSVHGRGAFALRKFPRRALVAIYTGHRYSAKETDSLTVDSGLTYLFALSDGSVIDGARGGNDSRFMNHSCAPNCEAHETGAGSDLRIEVRAIRAIAPEEELFLDYQLIREPGDEAEYLCRCGAEVCRGTMLGTSR